MSMWLSRLFRRPPEASPEALQAFLARQSAFVAQKTVLDYCRVKAGRNERQTFAGAALDVTALAEAWLRPHAAGQASALADALTTLGGQVLDAAPAPAAERPALDAAREGLGRHLALLQDAPPLPADQMTMLAEAPLLATLPVHPDQRRGETPAIRGALRFHLVTTQQEMERGFDAPALVRRLIAE